MKKLLLLGVIGITTITSYTLADNYETCKGDSTCLNCMCGELKDYLENDCSTQEEECYETCTDEDCDMCGEMAQNCLQDAYIQFEDCTIAPEILDNWNLNHGACYGQRIPGGGNEGGNEGGSEGGGIVEGGINAFSGIIERLGSIFGEFGPYIIYIAIACLGISLLFKALKYILGFTNNSAKNSIGGRAGMKERRRRRRRKRRQTYSYDEVKYNPQDYFPITHPKNIRKARFKRRTRQRRNNFMGGIGKNIDRL